MPPYRGHVIADGGCVYAGDVAKAFGAGADFVMLGGMLVRDELEGEVVNGETVQFYGMSLDEVQWQDMAEEKMVDLQKVRVVNTEEVPGSSRGTVTEILGGVRLSCTYIGARN